MVDLCHTVWPVRPVTCLRQSLHMPGTNLTATPSLPATCQVSPVDLLRADIALELLFKTPSIPAIVKLFSLVLQYTVLTAVAETPKTLLFPLNWAHGFVPVLPRVVLDSLQCPAPFLIGIPSSYAFKRDFPYVLGLVVVDLISHCSECDLHHGKHLLIHHRQASAYPFPEGEVQSCFHSFVSSLWVAFTRLSPAFGRTAAHVPRH
jgi:hypothetical protein